MRWFHAPGPAYLIRLRRRGVICTSKYLRQRGGRLGPRTEQRIGPVLQDIRSYRVFRVVVGLDCRKKTFYPIEILNTMFKILGPPWGHHVRRDCPSINNVRVGLQCLA
jgi:hypothetical protein